MRHSRVEDEVAREPRAIPLGHAGLLDRVVESVENGPDDPLDDSATLPEVESADGRGREEGGGVCAPLAGSAVPERLALAVSPERLPGARSYAGIRPR
ncbi:hypothetical protein [Rathayibacter rathayi]|uniref:hypothetical protein n=1 Tax=Rathayibacter rathayi TaxID=33887 RepID=UPI002157230E|nr:hypothetical protein [Rathayibacter rathayi]